MIDAHRHSVRNRTAFALSFYAGLRACEISALRIEDVFDADGGVRDVINLAADQTKGSEANTVLVSRRLQNSLKQYARELGPRLKQPASHLIFSGKGDGFTAQTMVNLFARFYRLAGIKGASSHSGRRQFLTELADKGVNVRVIQALARHQDIGTTQRYIDYNEAKLRSAIELI